MTLDTDADDLAKVPDGAYIVPPQMWADILQLAHQSDPEDFARGEAVPMTGYDPCPRGCGRPVLVTARRDTDALATHDVALLFLRHTPAGPVLGIVSSDHDCQGAPR